MDNKSLNKIVKDRMNQETHRKPCTYDIQTCIYRQVEIKLQKQNKF